MTPESAQRRDKVLELMAEYIDLGDGLADVDSPAEIDRVLAEMAKTKAQIDALIEEQMRIDRLQ